MSQEVFVGDVDGRALRYGKSLVTNGSTIRPGLICYETDTATAAIAGASQEPSGVAYGARHQVYRPQSKYFDTGEQLVLLKGDFQCYYSAAFFVGQTLPSFGADIYVADGGIMHTSGTHKIGLCTKTLTRIEEVGGVGTSQNLVEITFEIGKVS
jgi:hypothetical protein